MWFVKSSRKGLLELISNNDALYSFDIKNSKDPDENFEEQELLLIWRNKPAFSSIRIPLPNVICVQKGRTREFLAWVGTYIQTLKPLTAFCRVLEIGDFIEYRNKFQGVLKNEINCESIGAVVGEAVTHMLNQNFKNLSPSAIMSTLSFAFAKETASDIGIRGYNLLYERWIKARELTNQNKRVLDHKKIKFIWDIITDHNSKADIFGKRENTFINSIIEAYISIKEEGIICKEVWPKLVKDQIDDYFLISDSKTPREENIKKFEHFTKHFDQQYNIELPVKAFLLGYLAYKVAPGHVDFFTLLVPFTKNYPESILWYFILVSLHKSKEIYNYNNGLIWRILRNLRSSGDIFAIPQCDLSFEELETYLNVDNPNMDFITDNHTHVVLEIMPCVDVTMYWPPTKTSEQLELFQKDNQNEKKEYTLQKLGQALKTAQKIYNEYKGMESNKKYS